MAWINDFKFVSMGCSCPCTIILTKIYTVLGILIHTHAVHASAYTATAATMVAFIPSLQGVGVRVHVCGGVNMHMQCMCVAMWWGMCGDSGACGWAMGGW